MEPLTLPPPLTKEPKVRSTMVLLPDETDLTGLILPMRLRPLIGRRPQ